MCGRATGRWGELRLAKLSLAVSDSFLFERRKRERRKRDGGRKEGHGGPYGTPELPPLDPLLSWDHPAGQEPQISSFSSSCTQPALDLIACPILLLASDFSAAFLFRFLARSLSLFLFLPSSFLSTILAEQKLIASRSEPRERGPKIDLMRIIPALIAKAWNSTSSACAASSSAGWSTCWLPSVNHS